MKKSDKNLTILSAPFIPIRFISFPVTGSTAAEFKPGRTGVELDDGSESSKIESLKITEEQL